MSSFIFRTSCMLAGCIALSICASPVAQAAMNPSFEIDPQVLAGAGRPAKPAPKPQKPSAALVGAQSSASPKAHIVHRTRQGGGDGSRKRAQRAKGSLARRSASTASGRAPFQTLRLEASPASLTSQEAAFKFTEFWKTVAPQASLVQKPLVFHSPAYSLTLDPQKFPVFSAMDGARIVVDQEASIPPLVKSLIMEQEPGIRIVSESPVNSRPFLASMLDAAGFYSVEEDFTVEFGVDPRLRVHSDFKVEKTAESLIKQDVALVNSGRVALPQALTSFLKKEGFTAHEPFASLKPAVVGGPQYPVYQVSASNRIEMVDTILTALSVGYRSDYQVDVFGRDNNGISLSVRAQRYFERNGQRCVVTGFDGDPVTYTLFRILETKGYKVVILDGQDDFRKVSEKVLASLHLPAQYAFHTLWPDNGSNYSLQMSGFRLEGAAVPGGALFLTNLQLDPVIRDLLSVNGFDVQKK